MKKVIPPLLPLVEKLKLCPSLDDSITEKMLIETWDSFRGLDPEHGDAITSAMIAGLILYDEEVFAELLSGVEFTQLATLARKALERYKQLTNPPNKLGKTITAAITKELK